MMISQENNRKKNYINGRDRMSCVVLIGCIMLFFLLGTIVFHRISYLIITQSEENCLALAIKTAGEIDADRFLEIDSEDDEYYGIIMDKLMDSYLTDYIKYIYAMKLMDGAPVFVVDADPKEPAKLFHPHKMEDSMKEAFDGRPSYDRYATTDEWGTYYSAYAPIKDKLGNTVGIVGIDIDISHSNNYLLALRNMLTVIMVIFTVLMFGVYLYISMRLTEKDILTGLPNYESAVKYGSRIEKKDIMDEYTAVIMNIKGFKNINQKYGYMEGNRVLFRFAQKLMQSKKPSDFIARIGNDNFLALLKNDGADKFIKNLQRCNPPSYGESDTGTFPAPIRCGIYKALNNDSIERVISICTVSMNHSREHGNSDFTFYDSSIYEDVIENGNTLASYRRAIRDGEFRIFYQPKVDIATEKLIGAEALVRWYRENEFVPPSRFIPILESEGFVTELDEYILRMVCKDIKHWENVGLKTVRISTNFSKIHLDNPDFGDKVIDIIDSMGVKHNNLCIEMTESSGYSNLEALNVFVKKMSKEGITVAMDDFGTGYSSLSLLGDMGMHEIKIDKSFIDRISDGSEEKRKFVANVIHMVKDLGRSVVCEGVETKEQLEFVKAAGCDTVQGFYYDMPLSVNDFEKRLNRPDYSKKDKSGAGGNK